jgi:hypothetical protein
MSDRPSANRSFSDVETRLSAAAAAAAAAALGLKSEALTLQYQQCVY